MKKIIVLCFAAVALASCASVGKYLSIEKNIRKVEIGMTEREVVAIVGNHYEVGGMARNMKTLMYDYQMDDGSRKQYLFTFVDGKLQSYETRFLTSNVHDHSHSHDGDDHR
jgi:hypothetical protein